jgi:hypothetical protein
MFVVCCYCCWTTICDGDTARIDSGINVLNLNKSESNGSPVGRICRCEDNNEMKTAVFCDTMPCSLVGIGWRFGKTTASSFKV